MLAFAGQPLIKALFVSPVLDMERLICDMMRWAGVGEQRLRREGEIATDFGETLSWRYLAYAREHPVAQWDVPTEILICRPGQSDRGVRRWTVFARRFGCGVTVMENGEHWFHTPEHLSVLEQWIAAHM